MKMSTNAWLLLLLLLLKTTEQQSTIAPDHGCNTTTVAAPTDDRCEIPPTTSNLVICAVILVFMIVTVSGNLVVVLVIAVTRELRQHNTYLILLSLAIADLLIGCVTMPLNAKRLLHNRAFCMSEEICWMGIVIERVLSIASITHLFVIGLDRYFSLKHTYRYREIMSSHKSLYLVISLIWLYATIWSLLGLLKWSEGRSPGMVGLVYLPQRSVCEADNELYYKVVFTVCFYIPIITLLYTYAFIYKTAVRHIKEIVRNDMNKKSVKDLIVKKKQLKTFVSVVVVFVFYMFCWIPISLLGLGVIDLTADDRLTTFAKIVIGDILPPFNSTTNPFIYVLSNRQFRKMLVNCFYRSIGKHHHSIVQPSIHTAISAEARNSNSLATKDSGNSRLSMPMESVETPTKSSPAKDSPKAYDTRVITNTNI